jgi:hypothetical protein
MTHPSACSPLVLDDTVQPRKLTQVVPALEFVLQCRVLVESRITSLGNVGGSGIRKMLNIVGGDFAGPQLRGHILPGGGDWHLICPDGVGIVNARCTFETDDGVLINIYNTGYRHAPEHVVASLDARTDVVDFDDYYIRTNTVFEAPRGKYEWMSRHVFVGIAERHPRVLFIRYFMLR